MEKSIEKTIGQMVAEDYRAAQVFKNHNIDFCCKGNRTIYEVAKQQGLESEALLAQLDQVMRESDNAPVDFNSWPLDLLTDYIEKKHHRYVEHQIPVLKEYLGKLCSVHGDKHPELFKIHAHFNTTASELAKHMKKEELILFPWIRKMATVNDESTKLQKPHFGTVNNPIAMMRQEHENEGERFLLISELSDGYNPPQDACNTYKVTYALLKEFEDDLHKHIHLENNILFPKAELLERRLSV